MAAVAASPESRYERISKVGYCGFIVFAAAHAALTACLEHSFVRGGFPSLCRHECQEWLVSVVYHPNFLVDHA